METTNTRDQPSNNSTRQKTEQCTEDRMVLEGVADRPGPKDFPLEKSLA